MGLKQRVDLLKLNVLMSSSGLHRHGLECAVPAGNARTSKHDHFHGCGGLKLATFARC